MVGMAGITGSVGWGRVVGAIAGVALFLGWTGWVVAAGWVTGWDVGVLGWFVEHRGVGWTGVAKGITFFGNPRHATVITVGVAGVVWWRFRDYRPAVLVGGTVLGAAGVSTVTKALVGRERPPVGTRLVVESNMSYPSGHATATAALVGVVVLVYLTSRPGRVRATLAVGAAVVTVVVMSVTRLYLGVHWLSDVVGGALLGTGVVLIAGVVQVFWWPGAILEGAVREGADQPVGQ
ncbi:phosphatase PAP2 family protein [Nocardia crassostreae]|uniref:phosphatase PAP2 family protein n=1 Tax=Nocardia crassostreae TaxID=53428 RepID=UPI00350E4431